MPILKNQRNSYLASSIENGRVSNFLLGCNIVSLILFSFSNHVCVWTDQNHLRLNNSSCFLLNRFWFLGYIDFCLVIRQRGRDSIIICSLEKKFCKKRRREIEPFCQRFQATGHEVTVQGAIQLFCFDSGGREAMFTMQPRAQRLFASTTGPPVDSKT